METNKPTSQNTALRPLNVDVPEDLMKRLKHLAVEGDTTLRAIVQAGLEETAAKLERKSSPNLRAVGKQEEPDSPNESV